MTAACLGTRASAACKQQQQLHEAHVLASPRSRPPGACSLSPAAAAAAAASLAAPPGASGESCLCPVCMGCHLLQRGGVVICQRGCVQLNLAQESLSLGDLRARLSQVFEVRMGVLRHCVPAWQAGGSRAAHAACSKDSTLPVPPANNCVHAPNLTRMRATRSCQQEHQGSGCSGRLAFRQEELFGTRNLTGGCSGCQFYRIVA